MPLSLVMHRATNHLSEKRIPEATRTARLLVLWSSRLSLLETIKNPDILIGQDVLYRLETALSRCAAGESVHRIIGEREFYGLNFAISTDTLEPRPDTEALVELVLPFLQKRCETKQIVTCLDMGTGSGAIAITLLTRIPKLYAIGIDNTKGALLIATKNAVKIGVSERFISQESNWFSTVKGKFDLVISNPPYIPEKDIIELEKIVRNYDPFDALNGGKDGLNFYRMLAKDGHRYLLRNGKIAVEIGKGQSRTVITIFERYGYKKKQEKKDLSGKVRALMFSCPKYRK